MEGSIVFARRSIQELCVPHTLLQIGKSELLSVIVYRMGNVNVVHCVDGHHPSFAASQTHLRTTPIGFVFVSLVRNETVAVHHQLWVSSLTRYRSDEFYFCRIMITVFSRGSERV